MSMPTEDLNETEALPGLVWPFVPHSIESGVIQDTKEAQGGFALWGKEGEPGKVYAAKPTDGIFIGIAVRTTMDCLNVTGYESGDEVNVLKKGRIWVRALGEVQAGKAAYVNDTNYGITATASGATAIAGGVFKSNAADGELVQLEIA